MAVTRLKFSGTGGSIQYIDLAKALSVANRKLHRQKQIYTVYGGFFVSESGGASTRCSINTAPNTWPVKRAVNRGFHMWRKMVAQTYDDTGTSMDKKYSDFKVYLNNAMGPAPLLPSDATGNILPAGEWDYSTFTQPTLIDPDLDGGLEHQASPDQWEVHILGPHTGSAPNFTRVGLVESWVNSRSPPDVVEPRDIPDSADPLVNLFDVGDVEDDRLEILNTENDITPYDDDTMWGMAESGSSSGTEGNNLQRVSVSFCNQSLGVAPVYGFEAICGLLQVAVTMADNESWELILDVESKGVKF